MGFLLLLFALSYGQAQPGNDLFANRIVLVGTNLTVADSNVGATTELGENIGTFLILKATVWYTWTAPTNGVVYFSGSAPDPNFSFSLGTYRGLTVNALIVPPPTSDGGFVVRVSWDDRDLGIVYIPENEARFWHWVDFIVTASNTTSRITFENIHRNLEMDAFSVVETSAAPTNDGTAAPAITTQPSSVTTVTGGSAVFSVAASGAGLSYFWQENGNLIPGAVGPTYTIPTVAFSDAGTYSVIVTNSFGAATSSNALLTVLTTPTNTNGPVLLSAIGNSARASFGNEVFEQVTLTFSEPLNVDTATENANYEVFRTSGGGDLLVSLVTVTNGSNVIIWTDPFTLRTPGENYTVRIFGVTDVLGKVIRPNPTIQQIRSEVVLIGFDRNNEWKYDINNGDRFGSGWEKIGYDDSAWSSGPSGLGRDVSANDVPIRTELPYMQDGAPAYFRKRFFLPSTTNGVTLALRHVVDDGAVFYLNGQEVFRYNVSTGAVTFATMATNAADPTPIRGPFDLSTSNLVAGENLLAVALIQGSATSSDMELAVELTATVSAFTNPPPAFETLPDQIAIVGQPLLITNRAVDSDFQKLTFSLGPNVPGAAKINPTNGLLAWRPTPDYGGTTNLIRVVITDSGSPSLSTTGSFLVIVSDYMVPSVGSTIVRAGQSTNIPLNIFSSVAISDPSFVLEYPTGRFSGLALSNVSPTLNADLQEFSPGRSSVLFTNTAGQSLRGTQNVAHLTFTAVSNQTSAFVPLVATDLQAKRLGGTAMVTSASGLGRVIVIGQEPLLEAGLSPNGAVQLGKR